MATLTLGFSRGGTVSFRPHDDLVGDIDSLKEWCHKHGQSFGTVFNSFLPAISYAVQNQVFRDESNGRYYIRADFGDILLRPPYYCKRNSVGTVFGDDSD